MPASIVVGGNGAKAIFTEFSGLNGSGSVLPNAGPVQFSSSNGAVATVDSQGNVSAIGAGSATITGLDTVNNLSASDTINVQGGVSAGAQSATLVLSAN